MAIFLIYQSASGAYRFNLKAGNGQVILTSESYTTKAGCENGIASVQKNASDDSKYERLESQNGKFYFNLKAGNSQIIGTSEMYESMAARDNGIESVKSNAAGAATEEG
jgi:uncharacterized protein YegP (UPF0339 family)